MTVGLGRMVNICNLCCNLCQPVQKQGVTFSPTAPIWDAQSHSLCGEQLRALTVVLNPFIAALKSHLHTKLLMYLCNARGDPAFSGCWKGTAVLRR